MPSGHFVRHLHRNSIIGTETGSTGTTQSRASQTRESYGCVSARCEGDLRNAGREAGADIGPSPRLGARSRCGSRSLADIRPGADEQPCPGEAIRRDTACKASDHRSGEAGTGFASGYARPSQPGVPHTLAEALAATYANQPALQAERAKLRATDENVPQALAGWRPTVVMAGTTAGYGDGFSRIYSRSSGTFLKAQTDRLIGT